MTLKKKIIIGFTLTAVGAASAGIGGMLPLLDATRALRQGDAKAAAIAAEAALHRAAWATTLSVGVAILTGLMMASTISRRLRRFSEDAEYLASGMARDPIPVSGRDEISIAASALNGLNGKIVALLDKQVSEE